MHRVDLGLQRAEGDLGDVALGRRAATSSSAARTGYISPISFSVMVRTRTPRWASLSTKRIASRSRSASRIGAWLTPYSFMR